jgi:hypothetical protein
MYNIKIIILTVLKYRCPLIYDRAIWMTHCNLKISSIKNTFEGLAEWLTW